MSPEEVETYVHQAAQRVDWPPLQAAELTTAVYCPMSASLSAMQSRLTNKLSAEYVGRQLKYYGHDQASRQAALSRMLRKVGDIEHKVEAAMRSADEFSWAPPLGSVGPLHLALYEDGTVREYDPFADDSRVGVILTATPDVAFALPNRLIRDGYELRLIQGSKLHVGSYHLAVDNTRLDVVADLETLAAMTLTAKYVGTRSDSVAISIVMTEGEGRHQRATFTHTERDGIEATIRQLVAMVEKHRSERSTEALMDFATGLHCLSCPVYQRCPAWVFDLRGLIGQPAHQLVPPRGLDDPAMTVELLLEVERIIKLIRPRLYHYVQKHGPITLQDGRQWGKRETDYCTYKGMQAHKVLSAMSGKKVPDDRIALSMSDALAILREIAKANDADEQKTIDTFHDRMDSAGDVTYKKTTRYELFSPTDEDMPEEPEAEAATNSEDKSEGTDP